MMPSRPAGDSRAHTPGDMPAAFGALQAGDLDTAERISEARLHQDAGHADAHFCLGVVAQRRGEPARAITRFEAALAADPQFVPAYGNLANSLAQLGRIDDAGQVVDRALALRPEPTPANHALGDLAYRVGRYADAGLFYRRALERDAAAAASLVGLGMTCRRLGQFDEALDCYERAARMQPGDPAICINRGNLLSDIGRVDDAAESYRQAIRLRPAHARSHLLLAGARRHRSRDADLEATEALYQRTDAASEDRQLLAFALGKACEELDEFDQAFDYVAEANRLHRRRHECSIDADRQRSERIRATFNAALFERCAGYGSDDARPVFIVGLPRSGTSLVEQILASHPQVYGAGELPDIEQICTSGATPFPDIAATLDAAGWHAWSQQYLDALPADGAAAARVTDKMPQNFWYLGMLAICFPRATIIHCRRDPMDTAWSLFKNHFGLDRHRWSYDLNDLGEYLLIHRDLLAHWRRVLPGRILDVDYESLVTDPDAGIRALLTHCGLEFDARCLAFHETRRPVQTLSFAQVRRPVYRDSIGRWRRYAGQLRPLAERLSPDEAR